ncbi:hypothetical protein EON65_37455 [archaeon]|nr:MAG: hypothetical protein EON65_37455 [archaeon]
MCYGFLLSFCYRRIGLQKLLSRGIKCLEVSVAEAPNQLATYRCAIPTTEEKLDAIEHTVLNVQPRPCMESS